MRQLNLVLRVTLPALLLALVLLLTGVAQAEQRIKDIASVQGVRSNQLVGYGLVVGLDGTGDQSSQAPFTIQSIRSMLSSQGIAIPENVNMQVDNVAAVMVTAELPPFARQGQEVDITVSSLGNADSLRGGTLLMTPLRGADGEIYAMAQGNMLVGGFGAEGADGSSITVNIPSAGTIPNGATVEREVNSPFSEQGDIVLNLNTPDFTTAHRVAEAINENLGPNTAQAQDAVSIQVQAPRTPNQRVSFMSFLEEIRVTPGDAPAQVIVNARTGSVVIGSEVKVRPAAITHGSLTVTITEAPFVSQPDPFTEGETMVVPQTDIEIEEEANPMFVFGPGTTLDEIVNAVNQVGAAPGDLVSILEALKRAGALRAELIII
ncbi:flagellar P-ring protein precursor FlgI [Alkalispirillum mobile]|uniref:Flagellar P-ring protein n=1 Tax=Alkalispirillum mobile TaxID=85925 RepID=A0A498C6G6_9GAMM|nr:flagellar basal body P-ring protein FlgI [Alkalispirillum mobile]RLK48670.1 flagellar P-ring protein precursor FlgI [Alkalispirillum mobile]